MSERGGNSNSRSESLDIHLSRSELADILGLRQKSRFLRFMFVAMDQDKNGAIEFKELEKFFLTLSKKGKKTDMIQYDDIVQIIMTNTQWSLSVQRLSNYNLTFLAS